MNRIGDDQRYQAGGVPRLVFQMSAPVKALRADTSSSRPGTNTTEAPPIWPTVTVPLIPASGGWQAAATLVPAVKVHTSVPARVVACSTPFQSPQ